MPAFNGVFLTPARSGVFLTPDQARGLKMTHRGRLVVARESVARGGGGRAGKMPAFNGVFLTPARSGVFLTPDQARGL